MIGLIWAQSANGKIGAAGAIPWQVPEDMAHFKDVTMGHPVVMGRKTWDSLPTKFRPLVGRQNIVVTRQDQWNADGATRAASVDDALRSIDTDTVWIIGGGEIYRAALPLATVLEVTEVDVEVSGDTEAPPIDTSWIRIAGEWQSSRNDGIRFRWLRYTT